MKQTAEDLRAALARIPTRRSWWSGSHSEADRIDQRCAAVALGDVVDSWRTARGRRAFAALLAASGAPKGRHNLFEAVVRWNDSTTYTKVRGAFLRAARAEARS